MGRKRDADERQPDPKDELSKEDWEKLGEISEELDDEGTSKGEDGDDDTGKPNGDDKPAYVFQTKKDFAEAVKPLIDDRLRREREKQERESEKQKAKAREDALKENEEFKDLAEERGKRIEALEAQLEETSNTITSMKKSAAINSALAEAGVNQKRLTAVMRFVDESQLEVDDDGNVTGVEDVIKEAKQEFPEGFKQSAEERPGGSPPSPDGTENGATSVQSDKEAEAEARNLTRSSL